MNKQEKLLKAFGYAMKLENQMEMQWLEDCSYNIDDYQNLRFITNLLQDLRLKE